MLFLHKHLGLLLVINKNKTRLFTIQRGSLSGAGSGASYGSTVTKFPIAFATSRVTVLLFCGTPSWDDTTAAQSRYTYALVGVADITSTQFRHSNKWGGRWLAIGY